MSHDDLNPTGPSQPGVDQAYETSGNPVSKEPAEQSQAQQKTLDASKTVDQRIPQQQPSTFDEATPSAAGYGIRGAGPGEEAFGKTSEQVGRHTELDADQMGAPGEGRVADAVSTHPGASGKEPGLESNLERKKAEQAPLREAVQHEKEESFDVGGILGQRPGPANPVESNNYPNPNYR